MYIVTIPEIYEGRTKARLEKYSTKMKGAKPF